MTDRTDIRKLAPPWNEVAESGLSGSAFLDVANGGGQVLRGSTPARVDEKGRLKIPAHFRQAIEKKYFRSEPAAAASPEFYVTSIDGESIRLYPMPEWLKIEANLQGKSLFHPATAKLAVTTTYYGATATLDKQGRLLIPAHLRDRAGIVEEVCVLGQYTFLELWNRKKLEERLKSNPLTPEDLKDLAGMGF